jgi:hypothetical protein
LPKLIIAGASEHLHRRRNQEFVLLAIRIVAGGKE